MNVLAFAAALRRDSHNKKLAREAVRLLLAHGEAGAEFLDLREYPTPLYDGDIESAGIPDSVMALGTRIAEADALVVATPGYNGSISSVLKNTIDWLSRVKPAPLAGKHVLLLAASPGAWGGIRGLWHSRVPFEALGVHVFPQMMSLPGAGAAFDEESRLTEASAQQLQTLLRAFISHARTRAGLRAA